MYYIPTQNTNTIKMYTYVHKAIMKSHEEEEGYLLLNNFEIFTYHMHFIVMQTFVNITIHDNICETKGDSC
jgi:hypothetical protein